MLETILSGILIAWIFAYTIWGNLKGEEITEAKPKASSYALLVHGLPTTRESGAPDEKEIKRFFEKFGKIHCIEMIRDVDDLLECF